MLRRTFFGALAGGLIEAAPSKTPNIVLVLADDLGWHDIGCYGNTIFSTLNIDRLAREGARFTQAYAACPVCSPTRASIMTGKYPVRTGITDWIPGRPSHPKGPIVTPKTAERMQLEESTIPEQLRPAGYRSASVGKWHLGSEGFFPTDNGFDLNVGGNHRGSPPPSGKLGSSYFGPFELPNLVSKSQDDLITEMLTGAATKFIRDNKSKPFFLYLAHYAPHIPLQARKEAIARHSAKAGDKYNATYAAMVESVDESVGGVLKTLEESGIIDNTLVVFFSDNGGLRFEGQSRNAVTDNAPLRAGKGHLYEGGIREPLLMRLPGRAKAGSLIGTPVSSIDFLPTFCDLAGVKSKDVDGVSLAPLLAGKNIKPRPLFWHYPHYSNQGGAPGSAIREGDWKLIEFHTDGRRELYNVADDPAEKVNLINARADIATKMFTKLDAWRKQAGAVVPRKNPDADPAWPGWNLTGEEKPTPPK